LQGWRQWEHAEVRQKTKRGYGCIDVQSGSEADCYQDREEFVGRNSQGIGHIAPA
jgi:hypothetical protein